MPEATPPVSPEPGSRSCARKRRSRGGSGRGGLGGRDLGSRGRWTETSGEPAGRARSAGHYLETERVAPSGSGSGASSREQQVVPASQACPRPRGRTRAPNPGGGASGGGSDGAEAAALRAARAAPLPALPPRPSPPLPAPPACARACARPRGPCSSARSAQPASGPARLRGARQPGPPACEAACHVSVSEVEIQRKTRFIPPTAILYFIPNLIFIPTFYSRSVSTFSVAFLS